MTVLQVILLLTLVHSAACQTETNTPDAQRNVSASSVSVPRLRVITTTTTAPRLYVEPEPVIPAPPNPPPVPVPDFVIPGPVMTIGPKDFCVDNPPGPVPEPSDCPTCGGECGAVACMLGRAVCPRKRFCSCDHLCGFFNDCCEGFNSSCPALRDQGLRVSQRLQGLENRIDRCVSMRAYFPQTSSMKLLHTPMVVKCINGTLCPKIDELWTVTSDLNSIIPVVDLDTGVQFVSYECAKCNDVFNVQPWKATVDLRQQVPGPYKDLRTVSSFKYQQELDYFIGNWTSWGVFIHQVFFQPPDNVRLRQCPIPQTVGTCSESCSRNQELVRLCRDSPTIYSTSVSEPNTIFRNYYCAYCSWKNETSEIPFPPFPPQFGSKKTTCGAEPLTFFELLLFAGNIFIDIKAQFDNVNGVHLPLAPEPFCEVDHSELVPELLGCSDAPLVATPQWVCVEDPPGPIPKPTGCPTCDGRCGTTRCLDQTCRTQHFCSCDELCQFFNDCCEEFNTFCPAEYDRGASLMDSLQRYGNKIEPCVLVRVFVAEAGTPRFLRRGSLRFLRTPMVTKCKNGTTCSDGLPYDRFTPDLNSNIPVLDTDTGVHFANFECAQCNDVQNLIPWEMTLYVNQRYSLLYPHKDLSTVSALSYEEDLELLLQHAGDIQMSLRPPNDIPLRQCPLIPAEDTCSESCSRNEELVRLCKESPTVYSSLKEQPTVIFRNAFCAFCAWEAPLPQNAQPENSCGHIQLHPEMTANSGSISIDLHPEFNNSRGFYLPKADSPFCEADHRGRLPEPTGCPSCQGMCGTVARLDDGSRSRPLCSCDPLCLFYKDCCDRFVLHCPNQWEQGIIELQRRANYKGRLKCFPTKTDNTEAEIRMVYTCGDETESSCTNLTMHGQTMWHLRPNIADDTPTTDPETGVHYANLACAKCNNVTNAEQWQVNVKFYNWPEAEEDPAKIDMMKNNLTALYHAIRNSTHPLASALVTFVPPEGASLRRCFSGYDHVVPFISIVETCPETCHNKQLVDLCENGNVLYSALEPQIPNSDMGTRYFESTTFKNFHCGVCWWNYTMQYYYGNDLSSHMVCGKIGTAYRDIARQVGEVSLSLLFDFRPMRRTPASSRVTQNQTSTNGTELHPIDTDDTNSQISGIITTVCLVVSIVCLAIRIALQAFVPHFWTLAGRLQCQLAVAMLIAFGVLLISAFVQSHHVVCYVCAVVQNYAFLAMFAWMTTISWLMWTIFGSESIKSATKADSRSAFKLSIPAWLIPAIMTAVPVAMDFVISDDRFSSAFADPRCWYNESLPPLIYFGVPIAVCLVVNILLFVLTSIQLRKAFRNAKAVSKQDRTNFRVFMRLFLLMGLTWVLQFVAPYIDNLVVRAIFVVANSLQGLFLFISFVCQRKVLAHFVPSTTSSTDKSSSNMSNGHHRRQKVTMQTEVKSDTSSNATNHVEKEQEP